jgi:radical SAM superfamily enzyme YgiQ (UPF0313 family)
MQGRYVLREIDTIVSETASVPGKTVFFCDPSFALNKKFTTELMRALEPLNKKIAAESTLARLQDEQLMKDLARGGVKWLMVGVETLALKLRKHGSIDLEASLNQVVARAHDLGILVQGNFICGLDSDDLDGFDRIYECCDRSNLDAAHVNLLTPYPDTPLYSQLQIEGRIFDRNWENYDGQHVVYRPRRMTVDQLIEGYIGLQKRLAARRSILQEAVENIGNHGIGAESLVMVGHGLYRRFDAIKKARQLRKSQRQMARLVDVPAEPSVSGSSCGPVSSG